MNPLEKALKKTINNIEKDKTVIIKKARKLIKCTKCGHWYHSNGESGTNHKRFCKGS